MFLKQSPAFTLSLTVVISALIANHPLAHASSDLQNNIQAAAATLPQPTLYAAQKYTPNKPSQHYALGRADEQSADEDESDTEKSDGSEDSAMEERIAVMSHHSQGVHLQSDLLVAFVYAVAVAGILI
ncbi:hypothetical protein LPJ66_007050 [Kickxella alabastrina]|uniref:Uncharacterized protein n=1 Tax=Kickxella alabastrina TaxID=61397 RepID=A0ACC1I9Y2_9FUNG|nr:hypothetical protein LPJ66_007050 [Kickxella alabastrina]